MRTRNIVREALRRLEINDGDVVVMKRDEIPGGDWPEYVNRFARALGRTGREKCIVIALENIDAILVLDKEQMNRLGWYRKEAE